MLLNGCLQFSQVSIPQPDDAQVLPAQSPYGEGISSDVLEQKIRDREAGKVTYAECQIEDHLMRIKELVITTVARLQGEVRGGQTPRGVREERFSLEHSAMGYLYWDVGAVSFPEPDLNAALARFQHDVVSATVQVKCCAVGQATVQLNATPLVEIGESVAVVTE